jgi:endo-1,4-beta-xylanase
MLWDDENVYIAAVITDDKLSQNKTGGSIWNADAIEIFFSTLNAVGGHDEHYQYGFDFKDQSWLWDDMEGAGQSAAAYLQTASSITGDGYIIESAIPHSEITPLDWSVGSIIGYHPVIDDTDNGDREIQMKSR